MNKGVSFPIAKLLKEKGLDFFQKIIMLPVLMNTRQQILMPWRMEIQWEEVQVPSWIFIMIMLVLEKMLQKEEVN